MIELNQFYIAECTEFIRNNIGDNSIDLTITSPPYDDARNYNGFVFDYEKIFTELYRITKLGGVLVWIVGDQTKNFSETGTSFKQALFGMQCGFNLLDTMIYKKKNVPPTYPNIRRYIPSFEFMFVFSKGKPKTFHPIMDRENKYSGKIKKGNTQRQKDGTTKKVREYTPKEFGLRYNIWEYDVGKNKDTKDSLAFNHPARFPEQLATDHIITWSNDNDIVLDPMCGSGTTCKAAFLLNRNYIGIDISEEYINNIAIPRLQETIRRKL